MFSKAFCIRVVKTRLFGKELKKYLSINSSGAVALSHAAFGSGNGTILMDNVECIGTETDLGQCRFAGWSISDCSHTEDAAVICQDSEY